MDVTCGEFTFISDFDSGNLARVELVSVKDPAGGSNDVPDFEFNIWTNPDCAGTEFENGNRTWFYFGVKGGPPSSLVKFNLVNLNRQSKMYSQGMAPVYRVSPGRSHWERIRDKPSFSTEDNVFTLSYKHHLSDNPKAITYFAFTYPYSYTELQNQLSIIDNNLWTGDDCAHQPKLDDIYYHREIVCYSLEGRRVDLLTISSHHNITSTREPRLTHLFPDLAVLRPYKFVNKKVIFVSARVHPGETPSSFVLNGLLSLLISPDDPAALALRRMYVFKLIPMLNPDGVARGHYRTDTRGVNLNRVYTNPSPKLHPPVYAARALIRYHHYGVEVPEELDGEGKLSQISNRVSGLSLDLSNNNLSLTEKSFLRSNVSSSSGSESFPGSTVVDPDEVKENEPTSFCSKKDSASLFNNVGIDKIIPEPAISGLFLYIDFHGHASKKGIFMYGNHFPGLTDNVECMLLPKLMSLNSHNFHFSACNFSERNMYLRDRNGGLSREGSGRVAVLKATGLIRSYTLECNYNTGHTVNNLPPLQQEPQERRSSNLVVPPKYNPHVFEEVGRALGYSILDLTGSNPNSRLGNSEYRTLSGVREWLRTRAGVPVSIIRSKPIQQVRAGCRLAPLVDVKPIRENRCVLPSGRSKVLQMRAKCTAVAAIASGSKTPHPLRKTKKSDEPGTKKSSKRMKVSDENKTKGWKANKTEDVMLTWQKVGRLEKKSSGETGRRHLAAERRKKPKPK